MLNDILKKAFLQPEEQKIIVKAEDLPMDGGVDFTLTYFEPKVNSDYTLKFIQNVEDGGENFTHRKVYKKLPDPTRKGKTFQFISSGNAKTCKALDLFFELNTAKKAGDIVAGQKIDDFMSATNQGCCVIQIQDSPDKAEIGLFRLFSFSTYGPNATVANLINEKENPTPAQIKAGYEKENIFDLFDSPIMLLSCVESTYDGQKGRDFTKSSWGKKNRGAFIVDAEGKIHEFSKNDIVNGDFSPESEKAFMLLLEKLQNPQISVHNYFAYKAIGNPKNSEDTESYLVNLHKKIDEIIPVIRNAKSIGEVLAYGKVDESSNNGAPDGATMIGGAKASDILKDSLPSELQNSSLNQNQSPTQAAAPNAASVGNDDVDEILNS